jgi:hypothetical protein
MKEFIVLKNREAREKICRVCGCTQANLSQALRFDRNSKSCIAMRKMAMENGGTLFIQKEWQQ